MAVPVIYGLGTMQGLALCVPVSGTPARAAYPEKPVKIIVPYGAGGSSDMSARLIARR